MNQAEFDHRKRNRSALLIVMCILPDEISSHQEDASVAHVASPVPASRTFDYLLPEAMGPPKPGAACAKAVRQAARARAFVVSVSDHSELPLDEFKIGH